MENEFQKSFLETTNLPDIQTYFVNQVFEFQELMMRYNCAIREVRTKLEVLNDELSIHHKRNPIEFITSRIKKPASIVEKLQRYGETVSVEAIENSLNDVAGVRVICSFIDDIYAVADMLLRQDDVTLVKRKKTISKIPKTTATEASILLLKFQSSSPIRRKLCGWRFRFAPLPWISGPASITSSNIRKMWKTRKKYQRN